MDEFVSDSETLLSPWLRDPTVTTAVVLVIGLAVIRFLVTLVHRGIHRRVENPEAARTSKRLVSAVAYLVALLFITSVFRDKLGGITVAFGVAGAGIAFALQEVIASLAGWVAISTANFYRVGDRVLLGGIRGDVISVGMLRTTLMELGDWVKGDQYNGRIARVANSFVFKEPVYNYSSDFPFLWDEIVVPVKYGSDWKLFQRELERIAHELLGDYAATAKQSWTQMVKNYSIEDARVEPMISMTANDNWIEFTLRYVVEYKQRRSTKTKLFQAILEWFDDHTEEAGIASATFHLVEAPRLAVELHKSRL